MKLGFQEDSCISMFMAALFTVAKRWKKLKCLGMDESLTKYGICIE
jgi:hypothetical protein